MIIIYIYVCRQFRSQTILVPYYKSDENNNFGIKTNHKSNLSEDMKS